MLKAIGLMLAAILVIDAVVINYSFFRQKDSLKAASANLSELQAQIGEQNNEIAVLRRSISALQSQLADSDSKALSLQAQLLNAENGSANLQIQLNKVQGVFVGAAPNFTVGNLTVTPDLVKAGSSVAVAVTVSNMGKQAGTYRVLLEIREYSHEIYDDRGQDVILAAGETRKVTFDVTMFEKGNYMLSVGDVVQDLIVN
jgi:hypothetical protein